MSLRKRIERGLARARKERAAEIQPLLEEAHRAALQAAQQSDGFAYSDLIAFASYSDAHHFEARTYSRSELRREIHQPALAALHGLADEINQPDPAGMLRIVVQLPDGECHSAVLPVPEQEIQP